MYTLGLTTQYQYHYTWDYYHFKAVITQQKEIDYFNPKNWLTSTAIQKKRLS